MDVKAPRLYETIGPLKDAREISGDYTGKNMMLVRVVAAEKAAEPKNVDEKIDKRGVRFDSKKSADKDVNTVREFVVEDLRRLAAMDKAKSRADEFVAMAARDGWKNAVDKFNNLYGRGKGDVNTPSGKERTFTLNKRAGIHRMSNLELSGLRTRYEGNPIGRLFIDRANREDALMAKLYALVPADGNASVTPGTIVESKPGMGYYCLESMTVRRLYQEQFDMVKASEVVRSEFAESQSLAVEFYNPKNIVKRMKYVQLKDNQEANPSSAEPNAVGADNNRTDK
jgi:hypothetical protein